MGLIVEQNKFTPYFTNLGINVPAVLEKYEGCTYVGQFPPKSRGGFGDRAVDVFYQPTPDVLKGHTHYFCIFVNDDGTAYIANAAHVLDLDLTGVVDTAGNIIYARFQHDFRWTVDGEYGVDGGSWTQNYETNRWNMWGRTMGKTKLPKMISLRVVDDKIVVVDKTEEKLSA